MKSYKFLAMFFLVINLQTLVSFDPAYAGSHVSEEGKELHIEISGRDAYLLYSLLNIKPYLTDAGYGRKSFASYLDYSLDCSLKNTPLGHAECMIKVAFKGTIFTKVSWDQKELRIDFGNTSQALSSVLGNASEDGNKAFRTLDGKIEILCKAIQDRQEQYDCFGKILLPEHYLN